MPDYIKAVLTGGPCGGKTTAISRLSDTFSNMGWKVYRASEMATFILRGGVHFPSLSRSSVYLFQKNLLEAMLSVERLYENLAKAALAQGQNCIILCDRGAMDISAYMEQEDWERVCRELGGCETEFRDQRYDCVIHMVTAANGAREFYSSENNAARIESADLACTIDRTLMRAWMGHPSYILIDNGEGKVGFEAKLQRVTQAILGFAGLQDIRSVHGASRRKFLLANAELDWPIGIKLVPFQVEYTMLHHSSPDVIQRLRRRLSADQVATLTLASTRLTDDGGRIETRRNIDGREFEELMKQASPHHGMVEKRRQCFIWEDRYYQLDVFGGRHEGLVILEAYIPPEMELPAFLSRHSKEVTSDPQYKLNNLALL